MKFKPIWFDCKYCGVDFQASKRKLYCDDCITKHIKTPLPSSSTRMRMIRNREFITNHKKGKKCEICSYNKNPEILDFHHKNKGEKSKGVNYLMKTLKSIYTIKKEIEKCILVCPNCHRELHLKELKKNE
jgi:Zn finger protein HypA/HybF involved in hydrogenase expression